MQLDGPPEQDGLTEQAETAEDAVLLLMMNLGRRIRARHAGDAIDPSSMPLLYTLRCEGPLRLNDLAARLHLDASTVSRHVRNLEDNGTVSRTGDPGDRRASLIGVSERGEELLHQTFRHRRDLIGDALADWSDTDREQLRASLTRLTDSLTDSPKETTP